MSTYIEAFLPLFVSINVLGILPLFIGLTEELTEHDRRKLTILALSTALVIAFVILFAGQLVFQAMSITLNDLRVGGGFILLILSIRDLVFGDFSRRSVNGKDAHHVGIVPIGIPLVMGPAAITAIIVAQQNFGYVPALVSLVLNLALVLVVFFFGPRILSFFGASVSKAIAKVASLFLAAISVAMIRTGLFGMIELFLALRDA